MVRISLTILRLYSFSAWWNCQISFNKGFWHLSSLTSFLRESFVPLKSPICYIKVLIALKSICIMYRIMLAYNIWWSSFRIKDHQRNLLYFSFKRKSVKPIKILLALETSVRKYETLQFWSSQTDIFGIYWSALKSKPGQIVSDYHPLFYILCVLHLKFRFYFYFMDS